MCCLAWFRFESPGYLALLALLPLLIALSYRSLAGLGPARRVVALVARCVVVAVMILALAGAQRTQQVDDLSVIFLVDRSKSIPLDLQREAFRYLQRAADADDRQIDDRVGVIGFDGTADVDQLPMRTLEIDALTPPSEPDQTNLAGAIRLALALLPSDTSGRIVIVTDGNENVGDVLREAEQFSAANIPIDVLPLEYEHTNEVVIEQLKAPPTAAAEETVNLQLALRSQKRVTGRIRLWHNDQLRDLNGPDESGAGLRVTLEPGPNRFPIPVSLPVAGAHRFRAEFVPDDEDADTIVDNNIGQAFTVVSGQGRVLILTSATDLESPQSSALILQRALQTERLVCEVRTPDEITLDQVNLLEYSAVILADVSAGSFRDDEKSALALYVRDLGGGLIMIGGNDSFGAGGWLGSPVEEVMPVSFDVKHKKEFLKGALCLVMHACEVPDGNYLGQRSAIESVKSLSSRDLVGVLAWKWQNDNLGYWVVPLQDVGNRGEIIRAIKRMEMGDMPDLDAVMRPGVQALVARTDTSSRHMIVISDFDPQPPAQDLINTMKSNGITCSTIAIGYGGHRIDEPKARWIANSTGGRFYRTNDHSKLPQIFIKESREVRRSLVQDLTFSPQVVNPLSPLLSGMTQAAPPQLHGYVLTTAKPTATIPLTCKTEDGDDPVLAHWQAGLGKAVAFTSGLWPRWGYEWTDWPSFSKFWGQTVRWCSRQAEAAAFDITTSVQGGQAKIRIDAVDKNADAVRFMDIAGTLVAPDQQTQRLQLTQTGPGRAEAEFDVRTPGNYIVSLAYALGQGPEALSGTLRTGVTVAYSPEYAQLKPNIPLLEQLRTRTDGRMLTVTGAERVFDRAGMQPTETRHPMWETLLRWALLLFLIDVAVRRIAISPIAWARKSREFVAEMAGRRRPKSEAAAVLTTLKGTRDRVRQSQAPPSAGEESRAAPRPDAKFEARKPSDKASEDLGRALGGATQQDAPVVARPTGKKPTQSEADYTSRLLRAKKRARDEMKDEENNQDS